MGVVAIQGRVRLMLAGGGLPMAYRFNRAEGLAWGLVGLGVLVRLVRYVVDYPIWHDEAFLAVNFLDRGYLDLLRPLDYSQVSPILFLGIELTAVRLLGFSEWSLRLFPAFCGLVGVFLFRYVAARILRGMALVLAVGIFATAFYPIRHSAEVKPYASDLLCALVLLAWRQLVAVARAKPMVVGSERRRARASCPFQSRSVCRGGIERALGPEGARHPALRVRLGYLVYNVILAASFISVYFASICIQADALRSYYRFGYWRDAFPPWQEPWRLPGWLIGVHTGTTMAYPIGGERGASILTLVAVVLGALVLWRMGRSVVLRLLLAPCRDGALGGALGSISVRRGSANHAVSGALDLCAGGSRRGLADRSAAVGRPAAARLARGCGFDCRDRGVADRSRPDLSIQSLE